MTTFLSIPDILINYYYGYIDYIIDTYYLFIIIDIYYLTYFVMN